MRTIRHVRADHNPVRERVHRHQGEGESLVGDLYVDNRIGSGADSRASYIAETGGQCLHHGPKTVGETNIVNRYIKLITRGHRTRRHRPANTGLL